MSSADDPLQSALRDMFAKQNAAIKAHEQLRKSEAYANAMKRTEALVSDYALAMNAVSLMATRWDGFARSRLSLRMFDLFLESSITTWSLINEGLFNPARREMRFILEASIKVWWCDGASPDETVETKVDFLDDLGTARFREVVASLRPRLLDPKAAGEIFQLVTNLYSRLSTHVHASKAGVRVDLGRFKKGTYIGFETIGDVNKVNILLAQVLDISLASLFESFDRGLVGDIFVDELDERPKWAFHRTPLVKSISSHYDYKVERQSRLRCSDQDPA